MAIEPLICSAGGIPYNKPHLDAKDAEIERLRKQCEGLADAALKNGQGLLGYERALERIKALSESEAGEPLDEAIAIATAALAAA